MKQDNMRAGLALIECGIVRGGEPSDNVASPLIPPNILVSNRACVSASSCTKSESSVWGSTKDNGNTLVVNYNDHNGANYSGTSYSADGGVTFTQILPAPFALGHGENFGDPIVVFNSKLNEWFAGDLVTGCGGQGIGLWTSADGISWTLGACAHTGGADDRESMWVDNETTSAIYGRMYISWNDFNNNGALSIVHSDDGVIWSAPVILNASFIRDVQVTGSPRGAVLPQPPNSTVFVAAMDEGGGGANTRQNVMYKSIDGGVTWTSSTMGARFKPVGNSQCASNTYFEKVNPIWRHMGWGEPAVGPTGVVHYAYAGHGSGADPGDIFYVRSIDNGATWSARKKMNTDADTAFRTQWMPSVSADLNGKVTISWYDRRAATSACNLVSDPGCQYERVGRQSKTNGATFISPEITISSGLIPEPDQPDPGVQSCYAGDYDYDTALNGSAYITWTDGRVSVGGTHVQNVEFAKVPLP
jgi:hypothetical protein